MQCLTFIEFERLFKLQAKDAALVKSHLGVLFATIYDHLDSIEAVDKIWPGDAQFRRKFDRIKEKWIDPTTVPELHIKGPCYLPFDTRTQLRVYTSQKRIKQFTLDGLEFPSTIAG